MAKWEAGFGGSRLGESGMRYGEGVLIYLLLCIHMISLNFPPKREHTWRHTQCQSPAHSQGGPAHTQHAASMYPRPGSTNDNAFWRGSQAQWLCSLEHITKPL